MRPTYEQLKEELAKAKSELAETKSELAETKRKLSDAMELLRLALEEIADLKEKLQINSRNSSRPPSSDQKANTADKERKRRKSRKGVARPAYPPERVDRRLECTRSNCPHCGSQSIERSGVPEALQQAELPEVRAIITEYILHKYRCNGCGKHSLADLPSGVPDSAFGPRLMGLFATLTGVLHVAKREAIQLIKDLYEEDIGLGSAPNIEERVAKALDPVYNRIHALVVGGAFCRHFDETTWRDSGKRRYVWVASSSMAAFFKLHTNRSREAFEELVGKKTSTLCKKFWL
jgi:transposase